jgi:large subunit ribosomal protein L13
VKTYMAKPAEVERKWYVIDASGQTLGRLSSEVASILRGKHKADYTPHVDTGDYVIVINAQEIKLTGISTSMASIHYYYLVGQSI